MTNNLNSKQLAFDLIWENEHFYQVLRIFYAFYVLNPER